MTQPVALLALLASSLSLCPAGSRAQTASPRGARPGKDGLAYVFVPAGSS